MSFLVRNNNSVLGVSDPYYTTTTDFGDETHYWHGVDVTLNARLRNGLTVPGRHQHRPRRQRHLRRPDRPLRPADDAEHRRPSAASGRDRRSAGVQRHRAVADVAARARVVHDAQDRRPGERDPPLAAERPARRRRRDQRRVARRELPDDRRRSSRPRPAGRCAPA